nr:MAG TPA: Small, acid-soluble spore protein I [Caudoviricetes sp.]
MPGLGVLLRLLPYKCYYTVNIRNSQAVLLLLFTFV